MSEVKEKYYRATEKLLYNYKMLKVSIENMKAEIEELKKESGITGINYEGEKTSETHKITQPTEEQSLRNITQEYLLRKRIEITQNKIDRIDRALEGLNETERKIVVMRYIEGMQWFKIAYEVNYNERWCKELRKRAIEKLAIGIYGYTALLKHDISKTI
ncbi:sigma factor-like helix-turn-helix DNA-binding protein [Caloranaerobacter sp. DY30410]|uniref:sigma factor-like helix-turn-helix DNA-binding protein n=1 Tax=Caloranaerobacter sp. DY30410 TaxID=3238305 RepID=UPI003D02AF52